MPKIFTAGNHNVKSPNTCSDLSPLPENLRNQTSGGCSLYDLDPCQDVGRKKKIGNKANCDPMQSGSIINDLSENPNRQVINRYPSAIRGCDQGMLDLFKNVVVLDEDGKAWPVPIIFGTQEKAVAVILQNNVRKTNIPVVDRPMLPALALAQNGIEYSKDRYIYHKAKMLFRDATGKPGNYASEKYQRDTVFGIAAGIPIDISYTLYAWTRYIEDMNQILEQIIPKFSLLAYINIQNIPWEIGVSLDSMSNNIEMEPGDKSVRVVKYQFNFTAQSYIPQPITRNKSVLEIKTDYFNAVDPSEINEVYDRQEIGEKV